ncbi:MAG: DinB family protein [Bacteroidota bacterium]
MQYSELTLAEYSDYDAYYIGLVQGGELGPTLLASLASVEKFFADLPVELHEYRYAPGKWTIKDVLQHLIDVERIFAYRMLRYARADTLPLPGFDVDAYGRVQTTAGRPLADLLGEFSLLRRATVRMLMSFSPAELCRQGTASGLTASVRALGFKLVGHDRHHCGVVRDNYLGAGAGAK